MAIKLYKKYFYRMRLACFYIFLYKDYCMCYSFYLLYTHQNNQNHPLLHYLEWKFIHHLQNDLFCSKDVRHCLTKPNLHKLMVCWSGVMVMLGLSVNYTTYNYILATTCRRIAHAIVLHRNKRLILFDIIVDFSFL